MNPTRLLKDSSQIPHFIANWIEVLFIFKHTNVAGVAVVTSSHVANGVSFYMGQIERDIDCAFGLRWLHGRFAASFITHLQI